MVYVYVSDNIMRLNIYVDCFNWKWLYKIYIFSSDQMFLIDRALGLLDGSLPQTCLYNLHGRHHVPTYTSVVVSSY